MFVLEFDAIESNLLEGGNVEKLDVPLFTISSSKMRNVVRWLNLLDDTGIWKKIKNRIKVDHILTERFLLHYRCES